jgi:phospholipase/carboxylesterase
MEAPLQVITLEPAAAADACVIWLHGLGADGHDFEPIVPELQLRTDHRVRFRFPHAPIRPITINGGMEMRGWYDIGQNGLDQEVDAEGIRRSANAVKQMIDNELRFGIDSQRIVLAGFSQGGAIALHLGLRYAKPLAGILALSTYLPLADSLRAEASDAQKATPIFICHGIHDPLVPPSFGDSTTDNLRSAGYHVEFKTYPMAHAVCAEEIADIGKWLGACLV